MRHASVDTARARRTFPGVRRVLAALLVVPLLAACAPQDPVRPLIDPAKHKGYDVPTGPNDENAKAALLTTVEIVSADARDRADWTTYTFDYLNPLNDDVVFVRADLSPRELSGSMPTVSADGAATYFVGASQGGENHCWLVRLTGTPLNPTLEYGYAQDADCSAQSRAEITWSTVTWPEAEQAPSPISTDPADAIANGVDPNDPNASMPSASPESASPTSTDPADAIANGVDPNTDSPFASPSPTRSR